MYLGNLLSIFLFFTLLQQHHHETGASIVPRDFIAWQTHKRIKRIVYKNYNQAYCNNSILLLKPQISNGHSCYVGQNAKVFFPANLFYMSMEDSKHVVGLFPQKILRC